MIDIVIPDTVKVISTLNNDPSTWCEGARTDRKGCGRCGGCLMTQATALGFELREHPQQPPAPADFRAELLRLHNQARTTPLEIRENLNEVAQKHAEWMDRKNRMVHQSMQNVTAAGYRYVAENIGVYPTATQVFQAWMKSSGHRRNLTNKLYRFVGFGRSGRYWCTNFGA